MNKPRKTRRQTAGSLAAWTAASVANKRTVLPATLPPESIFFCDETGNTGSHFFDREQPIYAEGGWIIPSARIDEARAIIQELEVAAKLIPSTKGARLKRSPRGLAYIADVVERLGTIGRPALYLVEKRYAACQKAVEVFFDPNYNPTVNPQETFDAEVRQARAELFYATDTALIESFAAAYRGRDPIGVKDAGKDWRDYFLELGNVPVALGLDASLPGIAQHVAREFSALASGRVPRGYDSMNLPGLARVFQLINDGVPHVEIVHDECATFEAAYLHMFERLRRAKPRRFVFPDGRSHSVGFDNLHALRFCRSEDEPLLRAADYLVAAACAFARGAVDGEKPSRELRACAAGILGPINRAAKVRNRWNWNVPQLAEVFASEAWTSRVFAKSFRRPSFVPSPAIRS